MQTCICRTNMKSPIFSASSLTQHISECSSTCFISSSNTTKISKRPNGERRMHIFHRQIFLICETVLVTKRPIRIHVSASTTGDLIHSSSSIYVTSVLRQGHLCCRGYILLLFSLKRSSGTQNVFRQNLRFVHTFPVGQEST